MYSQEYVNVRRYRGKPSALGCKCNILILYVPTAVTLRGLQLQIDCMTAK